MTTTNNHNKIQTYDFLIVGAGLYGAVFAHEAMKKGRRVAVIDRREQPGGNLYCEDVQGIHVHRYGAHIFHTSDKEVWDYVNALVPFNRYTNSPLACYQGKLYHLPFNMNTFYDIWGIRTPDEATAKLNEQRALVEERMRAEGVDTPRNLEEQALLLVGTDIYERLIKGYTEKQWGRPCTDLPAFIIKRLPVRLTFDNNYFSDAFQGVPIGGYNKLIDKLLQGADCWTGTDFFGLEHSYEEDGHRVKGSFGNEIRTLKCRNILYTGEIDRFFDYRFGHLEYRTVEFDTKTLPMSNYQGNAVVNYTEATVPYTRIIEHKHFEMFNEQVYDTPLTVVSHEYPREWKPGLEPYYPINDEKNSTLYARYRQLADNTPHVLFGGRLAEYRYYDMAPTVRHALDAAKNFFS